MEIQEYIDIIKKAKRNSNLKIILFNIITIVSTLISAIVTLASVFSSNAVTCLLHIDKVIEPEAFSVAVITFSICIMIKSIDKNNELENIVKYNSVIRFDQSIPENKGERQMIKRDIERLYYYINIYDIANVKTDSDIHRKRMFHRKVIIAIAFILGVLIFTYGIITNETFPLIGFKIGLVIYPLVLGEYAVALYFREKLYPKWQKNIWKDKNFNDYKKTKGSMSLDCKVMIMKQTLQKLQYRYLIWTKSALGFSVIALIFSILQFANRLQEFVDFMDFPFENLQIISVIFLFISSIISIIELLLDKYQIGVISRMTRLCELSNEEDQVKERILNEGFSSLIAEGIINELDISRGKFEITMKRIENNQEVNLADCPIKENEIRTGLSRINGFLIYVLLENGVYSLWYKEWNIPLFSELSGISLVIYILLVVAVSQLKERKYKKLLPIEK